MKLLSFCIRALLLWSLVIGTVAYIVPTASALAVPCRDIKSVQDSAIATANTSKGGHLTQHIYGMVPPSGSSQARKTLFESKGKWDTAWGAYKARVQNPVNCGAGGQAQQSVTLQSLGIEFLGAYSCTQANAQTGECTQKDSYMAREVFFGFILQDKQWILNTAFPEPLT